MTEELNQAAKSSAMRLLVHRPRSVNEIRQRLLERFDSGIVSTIIVWLVENELVDDEKFAIWWTESRCKQKLLSVAMIRKELLEKGIHRNLIEKALKNIDDAKNAQLLADRISRTLDKSNPDTFKRKLYGRLLRRGFSSSLAITSVENALDSSRKTNAISLES